MAQDRVAIIGMACVFPGAHTPEALWENILAGRRSFRKMPDRRMPRASYWDPDPQAPDKTYCEQAALITGWSFDPVECHIPPVTAKVTDTTHWLALWTARAAFCDAGIDVSARDRSRIGVVIGNTLGGEFGRSAYLRHRWPFVERAVRRAAQSVPGAEETLERLVEEFRRNYLSPLPEITEDSLAGTMANTIAGRICNHFDLGGGGFIIDGACSSSLLAIANACEAVARGELEVALTGGVDVSLDPYELIGFAKARALALDDIRPYDKFASGMIPGEGCGLFVLMRESDARAAGLRVRAFICGWGYSSDGRGGMTAPRREGQVFAMRRAYARAGYPIATVELFEGHGTGTVVGDQVELDALVELLTEKPNPLPPAIGSVKGNIGHCKAAAGAAGMIKVVMALERKVIPPTSGCECPHPIFDRIGDRLRPSLEGRSWNERSTPRRASVSAFGFGGSNAHITIQEAGGLTSPLSHELELLGSAQSSELVLLSASDRPALQDRVGQLRAVVHCLSRAELTDLAADLAQCDQGGPCRLALVAASPWELENQLQEIGFRLTQTRLEELEKPSAGIFAGDLSEATSLPKLAALVPGQGAQHLGMAGGFARRYGFVRGMYARCDAAIADILPGGISRWAADPRGASLDLREQAARELRATAVAQPAITAASLATFKVLAHHGITPDLIIGHSLGEIAGLAASGACSAETAVRLAAIRGRVMAALHLPDPGGMAAISAPQNVVSDLIARCGGALVIANENGPRQTVVSGPTAAINDLVRFARNLKISCVRLNVSHAFHSPMVAPAAEAYRREIATIHFCPLQGKLVSTVRGQILSVDADLRQTLVEQIDRPVLFSEAIKCARTAGAAIWVEVGPGSALTGLVAGICNDEKVSALTTDRGGACVFEQLVTLIGRLWTKGMRVDTHRLFSDRFHRPLVKIDQLKFIGNPCEGDVGIKQSPTDNLPFAAAETNHADARSHALAFVQEWIVQRTGYPRESVAPELRLTDNLGLDSLKLTELLVALASQLQLEVPMHTDWMNSRLIDLVDYALGHRAGGVQAELDSGRSLRASPAAGIGPGGDWVMRFKVTQVDAPLAAEALHPPPRLAIAVVATAWCARVETFVETLRRSGFQPTFFDLGSVVRMERPASLGALIWLKCTDEPALELAETLLGLTRWAISRSFGGPVPMRFFVVRDDPAPQETRALDSGAAFLKSVQLENASILTKWIVVPTVWTSERVAAAVLAELRRAGPLVYYAYDTAGNRSTEAGVPLDARGTALALSATDVALVTGGAKGITRELARVLAARGVRLALIGTTVPSEPEIQQAIKDFEDGGATCCRYYRCDVSDASEISHVTGIIERDLGPITVVLHGAGISSPARIEKMRIESLRRTIQIKVSGLLNVLTVCPPERLVAVHVVSSVLGHTGMAGQADYAFANAWLDRMAAELHKRYPKLHALSVGFSIWKETGLGKKLGSVQMLDSLGVTSLTTAEGIAAYHATLAGDGNGPRLVVTGRLWPSLEAGLFARPAPPTSRFLEVILRYIPGVELISEATLGLERDAYIRDHIFEGTAVFPAVMEIEALVAAAQRCAGRTVLPRMRDVRFRAPIVVPRGLDLCIRILALCRHGPKLGNEVEVVIRTETDGFTMDYCSAVCSFDLDEVSLSIMPLKPPPLPEGIPLERTDFPALFQGPLFQRLYAARILEATSCLVDVIVPEDDSPFTGGQGRVLSIPFPAARDAYLQAASLLIGPGWLPTEVQEIRFLRPVPPGARVLCQCRTIAAHAQHHVADIDVFTLDGEPVEVFRGLAVERVTRERGNRPDANPFVASSLNAN